MKQLKGIFTALALLASFTAYAGGLPDRHIRPTPIRTELTALQAQVKALQAIVDRIPIGRVQGLTTDGIHAAALLPADATVDFGTCTDAGLLIGNAQGVNAAVGQVTSRITCMGYEYTYSGQDGTIQGLPGMEWDGANCTGNEYATRTVTAQLALNGYVFSLPGQFSNFAIASGTSLQTITVMSQSDAFGNCLDNSDSAFEDDVYTIVTNIPSVTGVPNTAVPVAKISN